MKENKTFYRRNIPLVAAFLLLIITSLIIGLTLAYNLTRKYVENEFYSKKIDVLENTTASYNDFFQNKIPEISFYQGFLDSAAVVKYADTVLRKYPFVSKIIFYDVQISNHPIKHGFKAQNFSMAPKAVYQFGDIIPADSIILYQRGQDSNLSLKAAAEFNKIAIKFSGFIESLDTTKAVNNDILNVFYSISANQITYMNIPRREEMLTFKNLMLKKLPPSPQYEQDVLTFQISPFQLRLKNNHSELYQELSIRPLTYESLDTDQDILTTDITLPAAFGDYKLYFISSKKFLDKEILRRFFPIASAFVFVYFILAFIALLIYRNLNINRKMFKLQYDFINNLTHEFKTPVSVIKIAGNNIRSANALSDAERIHYGKILDEEADKLNDLMNKLLSFTQIENRSIQIKEEVINLDIFVQSSINSYLIKYTDFNISYKINKVELFKTDPVLLTSIFQNLIDNAYKYSRPDSKELNINISLRKNNIVFIFKDKGIGIAKTELENVFKKFYRIQNEFNQEGSVGLGLAFCKELINFMNGSISIKSKVGSGSEFTVTLPYVV
jgi:two-component system phosphate regulon sensor histidine kinase PhoR